MMDSVVYWTGIATLAISTLGSLVVFLMLMIAIVNALGQRLWNTLLAYHDIRTLRAHLLQLEAEGKLKRKINS